MDDIELISLDTTQMVAASNDIDYPDGWTLRKRKTMFVFLFSQYLQGMEISTIMATLWSYVKNDFNDVDPYLWYDIISSGRFVLSLLFTSIVAKWFDRTRSTKSFMLIAVSLTNVGYILYMVHFSPYIPMLGLVLQGFTFIITVIINSEINRVYADDSIQRNFLYMLLACGFGQCIGPVMLIALDHIPEFRIGAITITYGNIAGLILLIMNSIRLIFTYFFTFDLSKEFDLKSHTKPATSENVQSSWISTVKQHFTFDVCFLVIQQIYTGFFVSFIVRCFPFVIDTLQYDNIILNVCYIGESVAMTFTSLVIGKMNLTSKGVYVSGILCLAAMFLCHLVLFLIKRKLGGAMNIILLCLLVFIHAFCWITDQTFIVVTLGKFVPSSVQSSTEGVRMILHLCGSFTATLTCAYIYKYFDYVMIGSAPLALFFFAVMVIRRKTLSNPRPRVR